MKILVTSATQQEIQPLIDWSGSSQWHDGMLVFEKGQAQVHVLITGVGMVATTYSLMRALTREKYDVALNFGLCGAYPDSGIGLTDVVNITQEQIGDLGAMDGGQFRTVFDLGLVDANEAPFTEGKLINPHELETIEYYADHTDARAITVNNASGNEEQIRQRIEVFAPQVESMEGAAFFYVMLREGIRFFEIRTVSNIVERRQKEKWQIPQAIKKLGDTAIEVIKFLACSELMV